MALERSAFVENYLAETRENLKTVDNSVIILQKEPDREEDLNGLMRALHTVKGSSRMLKFRNMELVAHSTESVFKGIKERRYELTTALMQLIFLGNTILRDGCDQIESGGEDSIEIDAYIAACDHAYGNEPFAEQMELARSRRSGRAEAAGTDDGEQETIREYESIRVKLADVEAIIETLNSVIIRQFQFKQVQESLKEIQTEVQRNAAASTGGDFGEVLKSMQGLQKTFTDQMVMLEQHSYKLQEQIMQLSMLPLELILGELPRTVAETAAILGKEIDFSVSGTDTLMDKAILEKLNDPVLHIIRNAVDHGIESPEQRIQAGKPENGTVAVYCTAEGGNMIMRITDDGRGIDRDAIIERALERGLVEEDDINEMSDTQVYSLIFLPGFSTRQIVGDLSGRGVGLDIVKSNIDKVKGKVTVHSVPGEGSEFILAVPLSLATVTGFFVRSAEEKFLIPSNFVHKIVRLNRDDTIRYFQKEAFRLENEIIPIYSLASLLGKPVIQREQYMYLVVVESLGERIGIIVDTVLQHAGLIYKPIPRNMQRLRPIQGIVFDENYRIINILFIPELMSRFKRIKAIDLIAEDMAEHAGTKTVLVVDDSRNTRDIIRSILQLDGFTVLTATDGIDALDQLKTARIDLVVTDVNMPRMDGITLIENIRKDVTYGDVPIIVVTSEAEDEIVEVARRAGANAHIQKTDFDRNNLANIAGDLAGK